MYLLRNGLPVGLNYANVDCDYYMWIEENILSGTGKSVRSGIDTRGGVYDGVFMG